MKVVVVGSGTVALEPDRVCAGYYVETGTSRVLLDCGPGTPHQLARFGLPWSGLTHVALTHFHTDHVAGLPLLIFAMRYGMSAPRTQPLGIVGPPGIHELMDRLADAFGDYLRNPGFPLAVHAMSDGEPWPVDGETRLLSRRTRHTEASIAYRLEGRDGIVGYTGDTGITEGLGEFFHGVDLLVAECSLPDEIGIDSHLTPSRVARLAADAHPGRLLVTHVYPQLEQRDLPTLIRAAGWDGALELARDGSTLEIHADGG